MMSDELLAAMDHLLLLAKQEGAYVCGFVFLGRPGGMITDLSVLSVGVGDGATNEKLYERLCVAARREATKSSHIPVRQPS